MHCALLENVVDYNQLYSLLQQNKADNIKIPFQAPISSMLEPYVVQSADQTTLTFYYDKKRFSHPTHSWSVYEYSSNSLIWQDIIGEKTLKVIFTASFKNFHPTSTAYWFEGFESLKHIEGLEQLNTSQVTDMRRMFSGCSSLTALDLSSFDTSQVTDMSGMFRGCSSLTALDLSSFSTSKVTNMGGMFDGCSSLTALDLSSFDTSEVTSMSCMFRGCSSLSTLDLSSFSSLKVTNMGGMFDGCSSLSTLDLSSFDTFQVTDMSFFQERNMSSMFRGCSSLTTLDLSHFDTFHVKDMSSMFRGCSSLTTLDLSSFNTFSWVKVKVKDMRMMFFGCSSLTTIYSNSSWSCRYSNEMFSGCNSLRGATTNVGNSCDVSMANPETGYFTKKVLSQEDEAYVHLSADKKTLTFYFDRKRNVRMRCYAWGIETTIRQNDQRTPEWLSSEVTSKEEITQIIIDESFRNVVPKTTASWFEGLSAVTEIRGLDNLNTSEVTDMSGMFAGCSALRTLDVSRFDTSQVTDMSGMFRGCSSLTTIYSNSSWSCRNSNDMFLGCNSLRGAATNVGKSIDVSMANPERGYFTKKVLSQEDEAYVHLSADKKTLTFYFDRKRNVRMRCYAWGIETTIRQNDQRTPEWLSSEVTSKEEITQIIIDESFRNVVPKTTASWFEGLSAVTEIRGLDNLNTSEVTDMSGMFAGCSALRTLDVSRFDTSQVTDMSGMFRGCKSLAELDLYFFDAAKVRDISEMFKDCKGLTALDLSSFVTSQVKDMSHTFYNCSSLTSLDLSGFDTSQVKDMHAMFKNCKSLTTLDLSNFQTSEVKNMGEMFSGCSTLTTILSFAFRNCFASEAMFYGCSSLQGAANFNEKYTDARMANPERGYFTKKEL